MNQPLKILLLEDELSACQEIENYIKTRDDVILTRYTSDSQEAARILPEDNPDVVIVDLELHYGTGNGISFLMELNELPLAKRPYILVTTNNSSRTTHDAVRTLGADFILAKYENTYSAKYVVDFLVMMRQLIQKRSSSFGIQSTPDNIQISDRTIRETINRELDKIGISPKAVGYKYLSDAIFIKTKDLDANIYSEICPQYNKSDASIERAIQNAINRAWRVGDPDELLHLYTARISAERGVPTVMEFIFYYATLFRTNFNIL